MKSQECVTPESRVCKDCGTEKPINEFYRKGNSGRFFTSCKDCCKARDKLNYEKNKEAKLAKCAIRRSEKKDYIKQYMAAYYLKNRERVLERCEEYRNRDGVKDRQRERGNQYYAARSAEIQSKRKAALMADEERRLRYIEYQKRHYQENKPMYRAKLNRYRVKKFSATPAWADLEAIKRVYQLADKISKETGIKHEVDHIVPLQGKTVCGLHVECNLQVIPYYQNRSKANKHMEG